MGNKITKTKDQNNKRGFYKELYGILLICVGFFITYCIFVPNSSGLIGRLIFDNFTYLFGFMAYIIPLVIIIFGWTIFTEEIVNWVYKIFGMTTFLVVSPSISALSGLDRVNEVPGGMFGYLISNIFVNLLGRFGAYLMVLLLTGFSLILITQPSIKSFFRMLSEKIKSFIEHIKAKEFARNDTSKKPAPKPIINIKKNEEFEKAPPEIVRPLKVKLEKSNLQKQEIKKLIVEQKKEVEVREDFTPHSEYTIPSIEYLEEPENVDDHISEEVLKKNAHILQRTLENFGVDAKVSSIVPGPVITRYEVELAPGVKVSNVTALSNDISLTMKAVSIRILAPIPGKSAIGIEIPNHKTAPVLFKEIIDTDEFKNSKSKLTIGLGKTVSGKPCISTIDKMPHLLVAGATGSGKSVCINTIIMSILYKARPDEVKFILIDPKMVELSYYKDMPHLYAPVIINPKEAAKTLYGLVLLMEKRYKKFADNAVRNIESYNAKMKKEGNPLEFYIVVIIDELADLMLVASREVEESIVRLTQMARAVGIHLVLATQRPSVDVITGVIKANLPSRIAFQVMSKTDSRVILDSQGAEDLLGRGDMLFLPTGAPKPKRIQGAFISEDEVQKVLKNIKKEFKPDYSTFKEDLSVPKNTDETEDDEQAQQLRHALNLVIERQKVSYDLLRANGFSGPKASNMLSLMEVKGFIEKPKGTNRWEIQMEEIEEYLGS
ncbi:DNA translocase FtsK 4TM domain-containing protein [bacterium]